MLTRSLCAPRATFDSMDFAISDEFLPATLTCPPLTDMEFAALCADHRDLRFEMTAEGDLIVKPPAFSIMGIRSAAVLGALSTWAARDGLGFVCNSSSSLVLPNGARRSANAAWFRRDRILALTPDEREGFFRLCPDFVIELRSPSDRTRTLREKMQEWIDNGAALAWLIEPEAKRVTIYRPGREPEEVAGMDSVSGEGPVEGFILQLGPVWDPFR